MTINSIITKSKIILLQISHLVKKLISKLRSLDINLIFQIITSTIAISAFLAAFNYFSKRPGVEINIMFASSKPEARYKPDKIREFYNEYNFKIPNSLKPILLISKEDSLSHIYLTADWTDHLQIFYQLQNNPNMYALDEYVMLRTEELEKDIGELRVLGTMMLGGEYGWSEWKFRKILSDLKNDKISAKDYYIFLCAGTSRRTIKQTVRIENTGEIDLKEFDLVIHAPFSRITKSRKGNISSTSFLSARTLFIAKSDSQSATLSFQNLRKGGSIFVDVTTRENQLTEADIGYTYKEENVLDTNSLWKNTFIILIIMFFLTLFFRMKKKEIF